MNEIYILGSSGMVGRSVVNRLRGEGKSFKTIGRSRDSDIHMDLSNIELFDFNEIKCNSRLLFLSAISSPDLCEAEPESAWLINVTNTSKFIEKLISKNVSILFASSDVIYGPSTGTPHTEYSNFNPKGVYAKSKYEIERLFSGRSNFYSMRLSYITGPNDKFISYLQRCHDAKKTAEIFDPFSRCIIFIKDVVDFVVGFFERGDTYPPVVNLCGDKLVSRLDLAREFSRKTPICIQLVDPEPTFFMVRERIIECKSQYLHEILGRQLIDVTKF